MDPAAVPSGGLPWVLAVPAFVFLVLAACGVVKWVALRAERELGIERGLTAMANARADKIQSEGAAALEAAERRADGLEKQIQAFLQEQLDRAHEQLRGAPRPKDPPAGVVRQKHTTQVLFDEFRKVAERLRREGPPMDSTQDV